LSSDCALYSVARAIGVEEGSGCLCSYCGDSRFSPTGEISKVSSSVRRLARFPAHEEICAGCRKLLGGRPGCDPPPLRMCNVLCRDGSLELTGPGGLRGIFVNPPRGKFVVSWSSSRKKHHILHAGISVKGRQLWGSDDGTIVVTSRHVDVFCAVEELVYDHGPRAVQSGEYKTSSVAREPFRWKALEESVMAYRGQRVFDLMCAIARRKEHRTDGIVGHEAKKSRGR
jgi:hypothetical protein